MLPLWPLNLLDSTSIYSVSIAYNTLCFAYDYITINEPSFSRRSRLWINCLNICSKLLPDYTQTDKMYDIMDSNFLTPKIRSKKISGLYSNYFESYIHFLQLILRNCYNLVIVCLKLHKTKFLSKNNNYQYYFSVTLQAINVLMFVHSTSISTAVKISVEPLKWYSFLTRFDLNTVKFNQIKS